MNSKYRFLACLVIWLAPSLLANAVSAAELRAEAWQAGTARIKITPEQPLWMAGYGGRDHPAEGKLTDLWAKALVLEDADGQRAALVTVDLIGLSRELSESICGQLEERCELQRSQIALCASHTHTGPALRRNLAPLHYLLVDPEQQRRIQAYTEWVEGKIVQVVEQAVRDLRPAELSWGSGTATFAVNRRNNRPESQVPQLRAEGKLQGPVDHDVPVLAVKGADGQLRAAVFGYACHATVLSFYQWSGDYPGFAQSAFEERHPGCLAMFWAGCGADQNPLPRRTVELAQDYGRQLAEAASSVLKEPTQTIAPKLVTRFREIDLPFIELPARDQIEQDAKSENRFVASRARMLLDRMNAGQPLEPTHPYPVQTWQLGDDVQLVVLGGEVVVDFALRLKKELRGQRTWVAGYANDVMAYIASKRVLAEGGYEGETAMIYYGLPTSWAPESENLIIEEVKRQLGEGKESRRSKRVKN